MELGEQWIDPWFTGGFILVAGAAIATGMTRLKFLVLLVASTTYFLLFRFPDVANHVNLVLCLNLAIIAVLAHSTIRRRMHPMHDYTVDAADTAHRLDPGVRHRRLRQTQL